MAEVVILGAGLTGLSAAYHLEQQNFFDYKIFDKNDRPGGLMRTEQDRGFLFDYTGHLVHIQNPYFKNFLENICGLKSFAQHTRKAFIFSHDTFIPYPFQMHLHGLPNDIILSCIKGYLKRHTHVKTPHDFYTWVAKYFGLGMGKYFFYPYNNKLFAYNVKKITPSWTGRFVPQTSFKTILEGALTPTTQSVGYNSSFYYPTTDGIEFIIKKLVSILKQPINTQHEVENIDIKNKIISFSSGQQERYNILISTIPLPVLLTKIQEPAHSFLKHAKKNLLSSSVINFNMGFSHDVLNDKHWIYFPEKKYSFYRVGFYHAISKHMVPHGCSSLYGELAFLSGTKTTKQQQYLLKTAVTQTLELLGCTTKDAIARKDLFIDHAYVIYNFWREQNIHKLLAACQAHNIYCTGRFGAWKYASMEEAVLDGQSVVETIANTPYNIFTKNAPSQREFI